MHELSLCENILQQLEAAAHTQNFQQVKTVWLAIGTLAGVDQQSMQFCFEVVVRHTLAEGATLKIINIPAQANCLNCKQIVGIEQYYDACCHCGSDALQIIRGDEMRIKELEVV